MKRNKELMYVYYLWGFVIYENRMVFYIGTEKKTFIFKTSEPSYKKSL